MLDGKNEIERLVKFTIKFQEGLFQKSKLFCIFRSVLFNEFGDNFLRICFYFDCINSVCKFPNINLSVL